MASAPVVYDVKCFGLCLIIRCLIQKRDARAVDLAMGKTGHGERHGISFKASNNPNRKMLLQNMVNLN